MERPVLDPKDHQGGKAYGELMKRMDKELDEINKNEFLNDDEYKDVEDLEKTLDEYKAKFLEYDLNTDGDIDYMALKRMMEKLDQTKTHVELMKMIRDTDTTGSETISYREFLWMMFGNKSTVWKMIMLFNAMATAQPEIPKGPPPQRTLSSLP